MPPSFVPRRRCSAPIGRVLLFCAPALVAASLSSAEAQRLTMPDTATGMYSPSVITSTPAPLPPTLATANVPLRDERPLLAVSSDAPQRMPSTTPDTPRQLPATDRPAPLTPPDNRWVVPTNAASTQPPGMQSAPLQTMNSPVALAPRPLPGDPTLEPPSHPLQPATPSTAASPSGASPAAHVALTSPSPLPTDMASARPPAAAPPMTTNTPDAADASPPTPDTEYPAFTGGKGPKSESKPSDAPSSGGLEAVITVIGSLSIVLGFFFAFVWVVRRSSPGGQRSLPSEVLEVLGRAPLMGKQQLQLLRLGRKLVLIVITPDGAETIAEVTDMEEVNRLAGLCRREQSKSSTAAFKQVLQQFTSREEEPAEPGYFGRDEASRGTDAERAAATLRKLSDQSSYGR